MIDSVVDSTRIPYFWDKTLPNSHVGAPNSYGLTGAADSKDEVMTALLAPLCDKRIRLFLHLRSDRVA